MISSNVTLEQHTK